MCIIITIVWVLSDEKVLVLSYGGLPLYYFGVPGAK